MPVYTDLNLTLKSHPGTGDVLKKIDVEAVKNSMRNLMFAGPWDSPFDPNYGINIKAVLFEPLTPDLIALINKKIIMAISEYEPRCIIEDTYVGEDPDNPNYLNIGILFHVQGNNKQETLNFSLTRVR